MTNFKNNLAVKFLVSTKAETITDKVNKWLEENSEYKILEIQPIMSFTDIKDKGSMMIGCLITYSYVQIFDDDE